MAAVFDNVPHQGLFLEFGVATGATLRHIGKLMDRHGIRQPLVGFDSFKGLPEDWAGEKEGGWAVHHPKGYFALDELPIFDDPKIKLEVGLFQDTLPDFLKKTEGDVAFVHIDSDLYSSCKFVLDALDERIVPGSIVQFDEVVGSWLNSQHEGKALQEYLERTGRVFHILGNSLHAMAIQFEK